MATIRWTIKAQRDLRSIHDFIAQTSQAYGTSVSTTIVAAVKPLEGFPMMGRVVPEYELRDVRELISPPYRIVYRLMAGDVIHVLAVADGRRRLTSLIGPDPRSIT
jgi:toxin ParE1/3/4